MEDEQQEEEGPGVKVGEAWMMVIIMMLGQRGLLL